jgi:translation initiation factor 2 subunit 1
MCNQERKESYDAIAKDASRVRMYEQKLPTEGEHVVVRITSVDDISTQVVLVEYEERAALMLHSNASSGRFNRAKKRLTAGHIDVAVVLTIDAKRGFIDVSKKHVDQANVEDCFKRFHKSKAARDILKAVCVKTNVDLLKLYETVGWPLATLYGHVLDGFLAIRDGEFELTRLRSVDGSDDGGGISSDVQSALITAIHLKLDLKIQKFRSQIAVNCSTFEGIDAIRDALRAGLNHLPGKKVDIKLIGGMGEADLRTSYRIETFHAVESEGVRILNEVQNVVEAAILSRGGEFAILRHPKCVSKNDDESLREQMETALKEVAQVAADDEADVNA